MAKNPQNQAKKPGNADKRGVRGANGRFQKGNRHSVGNPGPSGSNGLPGCSGVVGARR